MVVLPLQVFCTYLQRRNPCSCVTLESVVYVKIIPMLMSCTLVVWLTPD